MLTDYIYIPLNYTLAPIKVAIDKLCDYMYHAHGDTSGIDNNGDSNKDSDTIEDLSSENIVRIYDNTHILSQYAIFFAHPTHIIDNIYLGSAFNAASFYTLKQLQIKVIMNATKEISDYYPLNFVYCRYDVYDNNNDSLLEFLDKSYQDILYHQRNTGGNILVHCYMGRSRSASIVINYVMKRLNISVDQAVEFIRSKRTSVNITKKFHKDLSQSTFF